MSGGFRIEFFNTGVSAEGLGMICVVIPIAGFYLIPALKKWLLGKLK
ncbi:MAG: hypothetical protein MUE84_02275 [Hyphomonas sp.]|jgi:hypothetical protein|nr:hypothetical protein [Hyphomonas sp.]